MNALRTISGLLKCAGFAAALTLLASPKPAAGGVIFLNGGQVELDDVQIQIGGGGGLFFDGGNQGNQSDPKVKKAAAPAPDAAGPHLLELTDGSQIHGKLIALGKSELVWQRTDASQPLIFSPSDVRRLVLGGREPAKEGAANAALKLAGGDWLVGNVNAFTNDRFSVALGGGPAIEVDKKFVEWAYFSALPPDAYDGPRGTAGLAGWEQGISDSWSYVDESLVAGQAGPITRRFGALTEQIDIQFTAGDGGNQNRGLILWIRPEGSAAGYSPGTIYLRFQGNTISMNSYDGNSMKNQSVNFEQDAANAEKISRYRLLYDSKEGTLQVRVNGVRAAEWKVAIPKTPVRLGSLTFQPSYWSSETVWTLGSVKVQPWDGHALPDGDPDEAGKDIIKAASATRKAGGFEGITADSVKFSGAEVSRKEPVFLRFSRKPIAETSGAIARVWLRHRGEFDVTALGFKDGALKVRTHFAGDITLPMEALQAIEFPHKMGVLDQGNLAVTDTLVFKNGDQLRGSLIAATLDSALQWKPIKGAEVQFDKKLLSGVQFAQRKDAAVAAFGGAAVRWRNGDWLQGNLIALDKERFSFQTAIAERMEISRDGLAALYFGSGSDAPVWDGTSESDVWMEGAVAPGYWSPSRAQNDKNKKPKLWRQFDGSFTLMKSGRSSYSSGPNIGRKIDGLPDKCEVSFSLAGSYSAHFFFEENKPGIQVQCSGDHAYLYDMSPRGGRAFGNQQQQIDFGDAVSGERGLRHYTFFSERSTGRFYMAVNGKLVGQLSRKNGGESPKTGSAISIAPQTGETRPTLSNLWVAPWTGMLPPSAVKAKTDASLAPDPAAKPGTTPPSETPGDAIALVNGDETRGVLKRATKESFFVETEFGELEIPLKRAMVVELSFSPTPAVAGVRLRLAGKGAITAEKFRFENGRAFCQSAHAGEFQIPVAMLREIVFTSGAGSPFAGARAASSPIDGGVLNLGDLINIRN